MSQPQPASCPECIRLLNYFKAANQLIADIQRQKAEAAIRDNPQAFDALKPHLMQVRRRRDTAAEALKKHMLGHTR